MIAGLLSGAAGGMLTLASGDGSTSEGAVAIDSGNGTSALGGSEEREEGTRTTTTSWPWG